MVDRRVKEFAVVLLACLVAASRVRAQTCPSPTPSCSPTGVAVYTSSNNHYFVYNGHTLPLLGMSYENLCHVCLLPSVYASQYCSLTNFTSVFSTLQSNSNNIVRLVLAYNSSPGFHLQNTPFPHESPFHWTGTQWDPSQPVDSVWLTNLEAVVCSAYSNNLVVEVTLFDPWDPSWTHSPFNPVNTVNQNQGFTAQKYFASFDSGSTDTIQQNITARNTQKGIISAVVMGLKQYPNIIWQVANEPDLNAPTSISSVVTWEQSMANYLYGLDHTHIIMVNGHTGGSFAWNVPHATLESAHYTEINTTGFDGAIGLMRDATYNGQKAGVALGFDENQSVPNDQYQFRTPDDMRAEAWEFLMYTGGLFNGYSYRMNSQSQSVSTQLGTLHNILAVSSIGGITVSVDYNSMQQTTCNLSGDWCTGVPAWGVKDPQSGSCQGINQKIYWSTMTSTNASVLYIHHGVPMSQVPGGPPTFDGYSEAPCGDGQSTGYQTTATIIVPRGCWNIQWVEPRTGIVRASNWYSSPFNNGGHITVPSPLYTDDAVVVVRKQLSGYCSL